MQAAVCVGKTETAGVPRNALATNDHPLVRIALGCSFSRFRNCENVERPARGHDYRFLTSFRFPSSGIAQNIFFWTWPNLERTARPLVEDVGPLTQEFKKSYIDEKFTASKRRKK